MKQICTLVLTLILVSLLTVVAIAEEASNVSEKENAAVEAASQFTPQATPQVTSEAREAPSRRSERLLAPAPEAPDFRSLATNTARSSALFLGGVLILFGVWKRWNAAKNPESSLIRLIARKSLSPRASLFIAEIEGKRFLLAQNTESITFLSELDALDETGDAERSFSDYLPSSLAVCATKEGAQAA